MDFFKKSKIDLLEIVASILPTVLYIFIGIYMSKYSYTIINISIAFGMPLLFVGIWFILYIIKEKYNKINI